MQKAITIPTSRYSNSMARPPKARATVLAAAQKVLVERSSAAFTLDAVALEAGVSKGGLMYHFPSKEALLEALVAQAVSGVDEVLAVAAADGTPGAFTRAYLDSTVPVTAGAEPAVPAETGHALAAALAAAAAIDPRVAEPLRAAYGRWQDRLENDGIDPAAATAVRLAVDGWWLSTLIGLPALAPDVHARTRAFLEHLVQAERATATAAPANDGYSDACG